VKKSLPLLAGAIIVPLLAATVAAFAAGDEPGADLKTAPVVSSSTSATASLEAPVQLATPPTSATQAASPPAAQAPAVVLADDPETSTTTPQPPTQTTPVPPNEWPTPEPTTPPVASPVAPPGPVDMTVSWDGLKCARSEAWSVETTSGTKMMCPGSANP